MYIREISGPSEPSELLNLLISSSAATEQPAGRSAKRNESLRALARSLNAVVSQPKAVPQRSGLRSLLLIAIPHLSEDIAKQGSVLVLA